ncbi:ferritin-like domain-containing protein [Actinomycetes bacterium KLBMP 9797]
MSFDLDTYKREATSVDISDVDFDDFRDQPLSAEALRCLRYMTDVETHTICYLRDLLVTPSHQNPRITTFLTMWNFEEFWHGDVIDRILAVHDEANGLPRHREVRLAQGFRGNVIAPITQCLAAAVIGEDFIATHMTWGAVNEWSAHAAYGRLIQLEQHATLTKVLQRIQQQESRHLAFYMSEARERLARSSRARRVTRFALRRFWAPVGSTIAPRSETAFVLGHLLGGEGGSRVVRMLDQKVDKLPGQHGLNLTARGVAKFGVSPA